MLSSGSYSLGEVRTSKKNRSDGETTDPCNESFRIFVTKEMLSSWNESSKVNRKVSHHNIYLFIIRKIITKCETYFFK